jgi:bacterial/archaeal transporter family-2 protein
LPVPLISVGFYLLAVGAGVSFVFQQAVNANLRVEIGSPWWAGFVSYLGGTLAMLAMAIVLREPWLSGTTMGVRSSWISWTGGLFGAIYIAISILMLPRLGAATVVALIVVGQMIGSLIFDQFGLLGVPQHPATLARIAGATFLIFGAVLIRL